MNRFMNLRSIGVTAFGMAAMGAAGWIIAQSVQPWVEVRSVGAQAAAAPKVTMAAVIGTIK